MASSQPYQRADVIAHPAPFKNRKTDRYFVVLSDPAHPFHGEEYLVVALTSTERSAAIELGDDDWRFGGPPGDSFASPWYVLTVKHADISGAQGSLTDPAVDDIAAASASYLGMKTGASG